jgi:hypothetical protein
MRKKNCPNEITECPVCYETMKPKDVYLTQCGHSFHKSCLQRWVSIQEGETSCPMCRAYITPSFDQSSSRMIDTDSTNEELINEDLNMSNHCFQYCFIKNCLFYILVFSFRCFYYFCCFIFNCLFNILMFPFRCIYYFCCFIGKCFEIFLVLPFRYFCYFCYFVGTCLFNILIFPFRCFYYLCCFIGNCLFNILMFVFHCFYYFCYYLFVAFIIYVVSLAIVSSLNETF